jgi:hypothetical protein
LNGWDGDTLVVHSVGFNDKTWLNAAGQPHTEALRVTERAELIRVTQESLLPNGDYSA